MFLTSSTTILDQPLHLCKYRKFYVACQLNRTHLCRKKRRRHYIVDTQGCTCTSSDPSGNTKWNYNKIMTTHGMDNCYDCDDGNNGPGHPGLWICNICCPCPGNPQRSLGPWNNVYSEQRTGYCKSNNSMMMYYTKDGGENVMDGRGHTMKSCKDHHRNQKGYDNQWGVNAE